jgi:hypothetical protein
MVVRVSSEPGKDLPRARCRRLDAHDGATGVAVVQENRESHDHNGARATCAP